jgi:ribosome-associated toxin RatA of RatAB toxin-antitoxin module
MASVNVTKTITVDAASKDIFKAITSYSRYPKYMMGIKKVQIQKKIDKNKVVVRYVVSLLGRQISYDLNMTANPEKTLTWTLNKSKYLESNIGGWVLTPQGKGKCKIKYSLAFDLDIPVPSFMVKKGAKTYVDQMLTSFKEYCEDSL